jgi:hypothetical protein
VAGVSDEDAGGDAESVAAVADAVGEADVVALVVGVVLPVGDGLVVGVGLDEAGGVVPELVVDWVGVGFSLVSDGVGVGVFVGVGVGVDVSFSGSHCEAPCPLAAAKAAATGLTAATGLAVAARLPWARAVLTASPAVVVSKMPPAMRPAETGRTRAKHMETLPVLLVCSSTLLVCPGWHSHSRWTILSHEMVPMRCMPLVW